MSGIFLNFNGTSVLQLMSFFILMYFLVKLLYKPFLSMLEKRRDEVKSEYDKASKEREESEKIKKMARAELDEIRKNILNYEEESKKRVAEYELKERQRIDGEIKAMIENARSQIEEEKAKAQRVLETQVVTLSIALASKIIQQEIDEKSKREFLMKQLSKIGQTNEDK
ncbi:MAG: F0F1 ATP synthase subunit B [Thermotogae bacterium]|jgi:F-type H+-transporting ATPase subunit b|nr:F0F1 ATP synthase subunit B [Thermotogota bacterium]MCL5032867.1 F0F1 ATP synthase subunit B [Thermotogota bacterium]